MLNKCHSTSVSKSRRSWKYHPNVQYTPPRNATVELSRVGVGGEYWTWEFLYDLSIGRDGCVMLCGIYHFPVYIAVGLWCRKKTTQSAQKTDIRYVADLQTCCCRFAAICIQRKWWFTGDVTSIGLAGHRNVCLMMSCRRRCMAKMAHTLLHRESKNMPPNFISIASPNIDTFSKFSFWYTPRKVCNKPVILHHTLTASLHYLVRH